MGADMSPLGNQTRLLGVRMSILLLWLLAVTGSALVLTQSTITKPLRDVFERYIEERKEDYKTWPPCQGCAAYRGWMLRRSIGKLINCPMCSGFWLGIAWSMILGIVSFHGLSPRDYIQCARLFGVGIGYAFGGSIASAVAVAMWITLQEMHQALALWRWRMNPGELSDVGQVISEKEPYQVPAADVLALLDSAERPLFDENGAACWGLWTRNGGTVLLTHWGLLRELSSLLSRITDDADARTGMCDIISRIEANRDQVPHVSTNSGSASVVMYPRIHF